MAWYPQEDPKMGYLRHLVLLYGNTPDAWTPAKLRHYVAHLDAAGQPDDWLFDSFLFFPLEAPGGGSYGSDVNRGTTMTGEGDFYAIPMPKPGDKGDYEALLRLYFGEDGLLDHLQQTVASLKERLGAPPHPQNVVLIIPYPGIQQAMWGRLEPRGRVLNFSCLGQNLTRATEDRLAASVWYVNEAVARWQPQRWPDLNFLGFYWPFETVYRSWDVDDHWLLKELHQHLRSVEKRFLWIPFFATYNVHLLDDYQNYYFDLAFQQPNHLFYVNSSGIRRPAQAAEVRNAGFELEYDTGAWAPALKERHQRFRHYLDGGVHFGYMHAACAWYQGGQGLLNMYSNPPDPRDHGYYDDIYQFIKGSYKAKGSIEETP